MNGMFVCRCADCCRIDDDSRASIGVLVETLSDRRICLPWLSDEGAQATREQLLSSAIASDDSEISTKWTVERRGMNRSVSETFDRFASLRLNRPKTFDGQAYGRQIPIKAANRA